MAEKQTLEQKTSDWNTLIDSIAGTFEGIMDKDKGAIVSSLKQLAKAASSKMSTKQTTQVFTQNTINVDNVISYYLYSSQVTFEEEKGKLRLSDGFYSPSIQRLINDNSNESTELFCKLFQTLNKIEVVGENGLKKRTGLMEYRYDAV